MYGGLVHPVRHAGTGDFGDIAFKVFDADCDGELDYYEIESLLKVHGVSCC